jgi:guanylate kinase
MDKKGILIIISGFSGAGKGTIVKKLVKDYQYALSISATTRKPREYEQNGREYFFVSTDEFQGMIQHNQLIEWAQYINNYYGTPKSYVEEKLNSGEDIILEIEMLGALEVKKQYPEALLIFISPPTISELKTRLVGRGTEDAETISLRLNRAYDEVDVINAYDYIIINDDLDNCVEDIHSIIVSEHNRTFRNATLIERLRLELKKITRGED